MRHMTRLRRVALYVGALCMLWCSSAEGAETPIKVVTYNVGSGNSWKGTPIDLEGLAQQILDQQPDVIVLQEVSDRLPGVRWSQPLSQPDYWKRRLGMNGHYKAGTVAWSFYGSKLGSAGTLILSRYQIVSTDEDRQPSTRGYSRLGYLGVAFKVFSNDKMSVVLDVQGQRIRVAAMHLDWHFSLATALAAYANWLDQFPEPTILAGDANIAWTDLISGVTDGRANTSLKSVYGRYDVVPHAGTPEPCELQKDWILIRRGQLTFEDAGGYGKVAGECQRSDAEILSDHPLVYATVLREPVPLSNPGFERGLADWTSWSPGSGYATLTSGAHTGVRAVAQVGAGNVVYREIGGLRPWEDYEIAGWVRVNAGAHARLVVYSPVGMGYQESGTSDTQNGWMQLRVRYSADATGRVRVHLLGGEQDSDLIRWDDVTISPYDQK